MKSSQPVQSLTRLNICLTHFLQPGESDYANGYVMSDLLNSELFYSMETGG